MCDLETLCFPFTRLREYVLATELLGRLPPCTPDRLSLFTAGCNAMFGTKITEQNMKLFEDKALAMDKDAFRQRTLSHELKENMESIGLACGLPHYVLVPALDFLEQSGAQVTRLYHVDIFIFLLQLHQFVCKGCSTVLSAQRLT